MPPSFLGLPPRPQTVRKHKPPREHLGEEGVRQQGPGAHRLVSIRVWRTVEGTFLQLGRFPWWRTFGTSRTADVPLSVPPGSSEQLQHLVDKHTSGRTLTLLHPHELPCISNRFS